MRVSGSASFIALALLMAGIAGAAEQQRVQDPLALGDMRIISTEHTQEYLAKTGGLAQSIGTASVNASGNWSFELKDSRDRPVANIDLQLFQVGNLVFGRGIMKSFDKKDQAIAADGALMEGNTMVLGFVPMQEVVLYRVSINNAGADEVSGVFSAYSPIKDTFSGGVSGKKSVLRGFT